MKIKTVDIVKEEIKVKVIVITDEKVIDKLNRHHKLMEDFVSRQQYIHKKLEDVKIEI